MSNKSSIFFRKYKHNWRAPTFIIAWIGLVLGIIITIFGLYIKLGKGFYDQSIYSTRGTIIWFDYFQQFTIQNNLLLVVYYGLWLFCYKLKIFRNNKFLVLVASWITLVSAIAWFMISPVVIVNNTMKINWEATLDTFFVHLITPVLFVVFFFCAIKYSKIERTGELKYVKTWCYAFIYPFLYFVYLIVINAVSLPSSIFKYADIMNGHYYISVYGVLTNYNPSCIVPIFKNNQWSYTGNGIDVGDRLRLLTVPVGLLFYSIELVVFTYWSNRTSNFYSSKTIKK